jgi:hypothetical protein
MVDGMTMTLPLGYGDYKIGEIQMHIMHKQWV